MIKIEADEKFPRAKIILEILKEEYERERERRNSFNTRAGIFITVIIAIITIYMQMIPFAKIVQMYQLADKNKACILVVSILFLILSGGLILTAFLLFTSIVNSKEYKVIPIESMLEEKQSEIPEDILNYSLVQLFGKIIKNNREVNNKKEKKYSLAIKMTSIGTLIMIIAIIVILIIGG